MTETTTAPPAHDSIILDPGQAACIACSVPADGGERTSWTVHKVVDPRFADSPSQRPESRTVQFGRCAICAARKARAARLIEQCPAVAARVGPNALEALTSALDNLAAIGRPEPHLITDTDEGRVTLTRELLSVIRHLRGGQSWFASNVVYSIRHQAGAWDTAEAAPVPYPALRDDTRAMIRAGAANVLAERLARAEPDVRVTPPGGSLELSACALCGIGHITVTALRVLRDGGLENTRERLWETRETTGRTLGARGRAGNERGRFVLCRYCSDATANTLGLGPSATEAALLAYLKRSGLTGDGVDGVRAALLDPALEVSGLRAWAGIAVDDRGRLGVERAPNGRPFDHVALTERPTFTQSRDRSGPRPDHIEGHRPTRPEGHVGPVVVPADLTAVTGPELAQLDADARATFDALYGAPRGLTDDTVASLTALTVGIEAVAAETARRGM